MFGFNGINIFESTLAVEDTNLPVRPHLKGRTQSEQYHLRIQKKWVKRFGLEKKAIIFQTPKGLFVHPSLMPRLIDAFAQSCAIKGE